MMSVSLQSVCQKGGHLQRKQAVNVVCAFAEVKLKIGPQSVLWRTKPQWVLFFHVQQSSSGWYEIQDIVTIEADWLPEVAPHMYQKRRL